MKRKVLIFEASRENLIAAYRFLSSLEETSRPEIVFHSFVPEGLQMLEDGLSGVITDNVDVFDACNHRNIPVVLSVSPSDIGDTVIASRLEEISSIILGTTPSPRNWSNLWQKLFQRMG